MVIHFARGEHLDFDAYELEKANVTRLFVEYDVNENNRNYSQM